MKKVLILGMVLAFAVIGSADAEARLRLSLKGFSMASHNGTYTENSMKVEATDDNIVVRGGMTTTATNHEGTSTTTMEIDEYVSGLLDAGGEASSSKKTGEPPVITGSSYGGVEWSGSYDPNLSATMQESPTAPLSGTTPQQKSYVPLRGAWNR